eukprot:CAMPEP_0113661408 /NCGR_PEP_ID=MMETSP0017_2-20120614/33411_1 /TAXON_ID=2856 /ORGANISM="Cylindrotheca closterium" /LENGTH=240 /DNA_ID=CAMNT_0000576095 /DNA_START=152 /DNA_END=874 /DNA_ORIENTATION=- /assembly_acc=CAM_ASM_000147
MDPNGSVTKEIVATVDATVKADKNVTGVIHIPEEDWKLRLRMSVCDLLEKLAPKDKTATPGCCFRVFRPIQTSVIEWIEPRSTVAEAAVLLAVVDGDIDVHFTADEEEETGKTGTPGPVESTGAVYVTSQRMSRNKGKYYARTLKMPVIVGELVSESKSRFGNLVDNPSNRTIIRGELARRRNNELGFKNLRNRDMHAMVSWASALYWIPDRAELDRHYAMQHSDVAARARENKGLQNDR